MAGVGFIGEHPVHPDELDTAHVLLRAEWARRAAGVGEALGGDCSPPAWSSRPGIEDGPSYHSVGSYVVVMSPQKSVSG